MTNLSWKTFLKGLYKSFQKEGKNYKEGERGGVKICGDELIPDRYFRIADEKQKKSLRRIYW